MGGRFSLFNEMFGKRIEVAYEISTYDPNHIAAWKTISGPLPLTFKRVIEQVERVTQVNFLYEADRMPLIFKLSKPLNVASGTQALQSDFPRLKELMEARDI